MKTFIKHSISSALVDKMITAAIKQANKINQPMVIAILDESGSLKAYHVLLNLRHLLQNYLLYFATKS
jgi:uncharacterized protein GlcG (DUF336 family)